MFEKILVLILYLWVLVSKFSCYMTLRISSVILFFFLFPVEDMYYTKRCKFWVFFDIRLIIWIIKIQ